MRKNKVVWAEGTFLQTQHFQQQERYVEGLLNQKTRHLHNYWGFSGLILDRAALNHGQFRIESAIGILLDGTTFSIPDQDEARVPLDPPSRQTMHRFTTRVVELQDSNAGFTERARVQIGKPPYHAGCHYFELDKGHELWRQLANLERELWAIKGAA